MYVQRVIFDDIILMVRNSKMIRDVMVEKNSCRNCDAVLRMNESKSVYKKSVPRESIHMYDDK